MANHQGVTLKDHQDIPEAIPKDKKDSKKDKKDSQRNKTDFQKDQT